MDSQPFPARDGCIELGRRCLAFTRLLTPETYAFTNSPDDSIGAHLRHCLDFIVCFLRGLEKGVVDYDRRDRDSRIASDPEAFRVALSRALESLGRLERSQAERPLRVRMTADSAGAQSNCSSSVERELIFLAGHSLHHLAIVRLLAESRGVLVSGDLTTAFSTALHRKQMAAAESEPVDV